MADCFTSYSVAMICGCRHSVFVESQLFLSAGLPPPGLSAERVWLSLPARLVKKRPVFSLLVTLVMRHGPRLAQGNLIQQTQKCNNEGLQMRFWHRLPNKNGPARSVLSCQFILCSNGAYQRSYFYEPACQHADGLDIFNSGRRHSWKYTI